MALYPFIRPLAFALDAETAHRAAIGALRLAAGAARRRGFPDSLERVSLASISPRRSGLRRASTRTPRSPAQLLSHRLRLRRGRYGDAAAAAGQSEAAPVPAGRGRGRDQPPRFNNDGQPARSTAAASGQVPGSSASTWAPTRTARTASPIMSRRSRDEPVARLSHHQHQLAQHAGPAPLQDEGALDELLAAVQERAEQRAAIFLKVAPDRGGRARADREGCDKSEIDALIVGNATVSRPSFRSVSRAKPAACRARRSRRWRSRRCAISARPAAAKFR